MCHWMEKVRPCVCLMVGQDEAAPKGWEEAQKCVYPDNYKADKDDGFMRREPQNWMDTTKTASAAVSIGAIALAAIALL